MSKQTAPKTAIKWSEFFAHASDAYYRKSRIGDDFYTAVSTGELFGAVIARRIAQIASERWGEQEVAVVEFGAASGQLMSDIIKQMPECGDAANLRFYISEPKEQLKAQQLALLGDKVRHIDADFSAPRAIIVANELFDALPFELVINGHFTGVANNGVKIDCEQPTLKLVPLEKCAELLNGELATGVGEFLADLSRRFDEFSLLSFDYACASADCVSTRVFYRHQAPLYVREADLSALARGEADITYTPAIDQIRAHCERLGLYCSVQKQSSWLIDHGAAELATTQQRMQQLKHLCFGMGENFVAFEISKV